MFEKLKEAFYILPSVTPKKAEQLALDFVNLSEDEKREFLAHIQEASASLKKCPVCGNFTSSDLCEICKDPTRKNIICVVEEATDIPSIEATGYKGRYHVLGGRIDPLNKIMPSQLNIDSLLDRASSAEEIIIATNQNRKGAATARYIYNELKSRFPDLKITRPAHGIPEGAEICYVNPGTLKEAIEERRDF